jgi:tetratricopeptide (TPR) repeat protein
LEYKISIFLGFLIVFLIVLPLSVLQHSLGQNDTLTDLDAMSYYSNPQDHLNKNVNFTGKILDILPPASGLFGLQMYQAGDTSRNTIVVYSNPVQFSKDECVRVIGVSQPVTEYQNMFGATLSAAALRADSIDMIDCSESVEPARKIVNVEQSQEKGPIKITLHKVELSDKNTRVYLTIENTDPSEDILFYDFNSKAIQGKTQYITTNSYSVDYPRIESTIPSGIEENGVVLFEPLDPNESEAQFRFEVRDSSYDNLRFVFDVIVSPLEFYDKALGVNPKDALALNNKGVALFDLGNYTGAIEFFDKALVEDPNHPLALSNKGHAFNNLGIALFDLGNYTGAIELYDKALAIEPNDNTSLTNKGLALSSLGNYTGAIELYDKVLAIEPDNINALSNKAYALSLLGNNREAIDYSDKVLAIEPNDIKALLTKGLALFNLGDDQGVIRIIDKALAIEPDNKILLDLKDLAMQ